MNPYSRYYTYIKPIMKYKAVRVYSPIIFSIIMIVVFGLFAIRPTVGTIISLQKSIEQQQGILNQLTAKTKALEEGRKNFEAIPLEDKAKMINLLPDKTSLPKLLDNLYALASQNQATISGIQVQPLELQGDPTSISPNPTLQSIDFTLNVSGQYQQLVNFVGSINRSTRLIQITTVNFSKQGESPLLMTINAKAFYFKP